MFGVCLFLLRSFWIWVFAGCFSGFICVVLYLLFGGLFWFWVVLTGLGLLMGFCWFGFGNFLVGWFRFGFAILVLFACVVLS